MKRFILISALVASACSAPQKDIQQDKIVANYIKHKSPVPNEMALAIKNVSEKHQKTLQAISIVESNGTPWAVGKSGEKGAFQVLEKDWGLVSKNPTEQAMQAEKILDELLQASQNERHALAKYNGGSRPNKRAWKYADKVLKVRRTLG